MEKRSLEAKDNRNINAETELENRDLMGQEHPVVYKRMKTKLQAERVWIEQRKEAIGQQLEQLNKRADITSTWLELRKRVTGEIDELTDAGWRELFIALNLELHVRDRANPQTWRDGWYLDDNGLLRDQDARLLASMPRGTDRVDDLDIEICFGLTLGVEAEVGRRAGEIVFNGACRPFPVIMFSVKPPFPEGKGDRGIGLKYLTSASRPFPSPYPQGRLQALPALSGCYRQAGIALPYGGRSVLKLAGR